MFCLNLIDLAIQVYNLSTDLKSEPGKHLRSLKFG